MTKKKQLALVALCVLVLIVILTAGLWPFHSPANDVSWLADENGLRFGKHASIVSSREFENSAGRQDSPASVDIWLEPELTEDSSVILAFSTPTNPVQFYIRQSADDLFVGRRVLNSQHKLESAHIAVDHAFRAGEKILVTISSAANGTSVYLNGKLAKAVPQFVFTSDDLTGRLVVGNSPRQNLSWKGKMLGLAFYDRTLDASEARDHLTAWTGNDPVITLENKDTIAFYDFREHAGRIAHNQVSTGPDLDIPAKYFVLHPEFLENPIREFRRSWSYSEDLLINVAGFMPLGIVVFAYLYLVLHSKHSALIAIVLGGTVSLTIEVLQSFLPTRDSGMTDLFTNTLGTALGVILCKWMVSRDVFRKLIFGDVSYTGAATECAK